MQTHQRGNLPPVPTISKRQQGQLTKKIHQQGLQQYGRKGWRDLPEAERKAFITRGVLRHMALTAL